MSASIKEAKTVHLTHTGPYAGMAYCHISRQDTPRDAFIHSLYSDYKTWDFKDKLCPHCIDIYLSSDD